MASQLKAGDVINSRYRLKQAFTPGRAGEVWLVTRLDEDKEYVLKLPSFTAPVTTRDIQSSELQRELKFLEVLSQTNSPPIIRLIDRGLVQHDLSGHLPFLILELAPGENLSNLISQAVNVGKSMPILEVLEIFDILLETLSSAHNKGIIYNDVDVKHVFWNRLDSPYLVVQ